MTAKFRDSQILSKIMIVLAVVLFFVMLVFCGNYINIKMNGQTSSLPELSENDLNLLLRSAASESINNYDDLIEPVFIGIKNADSKICATVNGEARKTFENLVYNQLIKLFSGTSENKTFDDNIQKYEYIESLKNSDRFVLISFFSDIPAACFLPCMSQSYQVQNSNMLFDVKHLFLLSDENRDLYGVAVSSDYDINIIYPDSPVVFNKTTVESYDIGEGYSHFEFDERFLLSPIMTSSSFVNDVEIKPSSMVYGKDVSSSFVARLFDVFNFNENLVKSFSSKNYTEMYYVDDLFELFINDNGTVEFKSNDLSLGIGLDEFLGYSAANNGKYSFNDKIFAIKNLVNLLVEENALDDYCIVGVDYAEKNDVLSVYLKSFVNGGSVSQNVYDAVFKICGNNLVYAKYNACVLSFSQHESVCIPQKHANNLIVEKPFLEQNITFVPQLKLNESDENYSFGWALFDLEKGVNEVANR